MRLGELLLGFLSGGSCAVYTQLHVWTYSVHNIYNGFSVGVGFDGYSGVICVVMGHSEDYDFSPFRSVRYWLFRVAMSEFDFVACEGMYLLLFLYKKAMNRFALLTVKTC
jgi:hypothetical protein